MNKSTSFLCLKCRRNGHIAASRSLKTWPRDEMRWFFSGRRMERLTTSSQTSTEEESLCTRCQDLGLLDIFQHDMPWEKASDMNELARYGTVPCLPLGRVDTVEFLETCPLCRCLYAMTPGPSSSTQRIFIIPDWTMNRLTGEDPNVTDADDWSQFAKCLLVCLESGLDQHRFSTRVHRGDALTILQEDDPSHSLGGRIVVPDQIDIGIIREWMTSCSTLHSAKCAQRWGPDLREIKLVDVTTRQIVATPDDCVEYVALSYVWGGVNQQSYKLHSKLQRLPQTIEDTIELVRQLGIRYLWADSLCIDQSDPADKEQQIKKMSSIYQGACLTIVALSGSSAHSGLARLRNIRRIQPQLFCIVNGKRLVGLMPTLSQQIWCSPWGQRAWTLQEALLSSRCLYISDHQLYFECNGMQCCESLNDSRSWAHHIRLPQSPNYGAWLTSKTGGGCLRTSMELPSRRLERYGSKLTLYSYRSMTDPSDGLNAFSGILTFLEKLYPKGFHCGLPIEDFQWGLLWVAKGRSLRREGFPSWSWAGWQGGLWPGYPADHTNPHRYPVPLRIWKSQNGQLVELFSSINMEILNDPVFLASPTNEGSSGAFDLTKYPQRESGWYLFVEAILFRFIPDYSRPVRPFSIENGLYAFFKIRLRGIRCMIMIMSTDEELGIVGRMEKQRFVLLARDVINGSVYHYLLQLSSQGELEVRRTVITPIVPENRLDVLSELEPVKSRVVIS
jgi:hypothetical protein